jgi:5-methylcytosine-specific restriction endonuclease McrA
VAIPKAVKEFVLDRDERVCVLRSAHCSYVATDCDHRVGRGAGGNKRLDVPQNLVACCRKCNSHKEDNADFGADCVARGIKIRRSQSTQIDLERCLSTPVIFPDGTSWFLTPWGRQRHEEKAY